MRFETVSNAVVVGSAFLKDGGFRTVAGQSVSHASNLRTINGYPEHFFTNRDS
jgi:hypothetical protein